MAEICRFCDILKGNMIGKENIPIMEDPNYFSLASIGALIPGWVLIIPKAHNVSMKDLYITKDFIDFTNNMLHTMSSIYSEPFVAFEHGPNKCGSNTACGTNHAHLHLLPYNTSLYSDMVQSGLKWEECYPNQIASRVATNEYLFYSEIPSHSAWGEQKGYLHILEKPISQYFRKLIANQLNRTSEYDYKKYAHVDIAINTQQALSMARKHTQG